MYLDKEELINDICELVKEYTGTDVDGSFLFKYDLSIKIDQYREND